MEKKRLVVVVIIAAVVLICSVLFIVIFSSGNKGSQASDYSNYGSDQTGSDPTSSSMSSSRSNDMTAAEDKGADVGGDIDPSDITVTESMPSDYSDYDGSESVTGETTIEDELPVYRDE